jgi:hypothetical protein
MLTECIYREYLKKKSSPIKGVRPKGWATSKWFIKVTAILREEKSGLRNK